MLFLVLQLDYMAVKVTLAIAIGLVTESTLSPSIVNMIVVVII